MGSKTFAVGAYVERKVAGWPFGRLDIDDDVITVRCAPIPWFSPHRVSRDAITEISIYKNLVLDHLKFEDSGGVFAKVSLDLPVRPRRIIRELQSRGYPIVDHRRKSILP